MGCLQLNLQLSCSFSEGLPPRRLLGNRSPPVLATLPGNQPHLTLRSRLCQHRLRAVGSDHLFILSQAVPRASGVDYSTFIPLSAGFLFLYWIANFVVPELAITRRAESEEEDPSSSSSASNAAEATNPSDSGNGRQGRQRRKSPKAR